MKKTEFTTRVILSILMIGFLGSFFGYSQQTRKVQNSNPPLLKKVDKIRLVNAICKGMIDTYIFPEASKKVTALLKKNLKKGFYKKLSDPSQLAMQLTSDLRKINGDRHLRIMHNPRLARMIHQRQSSNPADKQEAFKRHLAQQQYRNFGFRKLERLAGNIGYLDLRAFESADIAGPTAVSAMNFLSNSDAVIIDLRYNGGGSPSMIQLISSYFLKYDTGERDGTHLNSFEYRAGKKRKQFWTLPFVPGKRMVDRDLYILTSRRTFSAAEEFTYNMKNLKRATIIGETTGGGAHPGKNIVIDNNYVMFIPYGRAVNPVTNTNWEGKGVTADIPVKAESALKKAHMLALEKLKKKYADTNKARLGQIDWVLAGLNAEMNPLSLKPMQLKSFSGRYSGNQRVLMDQDKLFFERQGTRYELVPMSKTLFKIKGIDYVRIAFKHNASGKVTGFDALFDNGRKRFNPRLD